MTHEEREYQRLIRFASSKPDKFVIDAQRHLCSTSLRYYSRFAWRVIEPSTPLISGWYLDCVRTLAATVTSDSSSPSESSVQVDLDADAYRLLPADTLLQMVQDVESKLKDLGNE